MEDATAVAEVVEVAPVTVNVELPEVVVGVEDPPETDKTLVALPSR